MERENLDGDAKGQGASGSNREAEKGGGSSPLRSGQPERIADCSAQNPDRSEIQCRFLGERGVLAQAQELQHLVLSHASVRSMDIRGIANLATKLAEFPRLGLAQLPTPLEPLRRLSAFLEGPCLWVKRDYATGLGFGGNKLRKLDYVLHEAMAARADTLVSGGLASAHSPSGPT